MVSEICAAFGCTPDVAVQQDFALVAAIFDYRKAQAAMGLFRMKDRAAAFDALQRSPELANMMIRMRRAQAGPGDALAAGNDAAGILALYREDDDEGEEG
jgi:hypothetical protein